MAMQRPNLQERLSYVASSLEHKTMSQEKQLTKINTLLSTSPRKQLTEPRVDYPWHQDTKYFSYITHNSYCKSHKDDNKQYICSKKHRLKHWGTTTNDKK